MKTFTTEILDTNDGSGDGILQLPPEFCEEEDWRENDTLLLKVENDTVVISNKSKEEREGLHKQLSLPLD